MRDKKYPTNSSSNIRVRVRENLCDKKGNMQHDLSINKLNNPIHSETRY
jgi:hypothetical protein